MNLKEHEDLLLKVEKAKSQIAKLRKQQTELEQEKAELEELRSNQDEWIHGRKEVGEALRGALAVLESEESNVVKMNELIRNARETFTSVLDDLKGVKEDQWAPATLKDELTRALVIVQRGRKELSMAKARIPALDERTAKEAPRISSPPAAASRTIAALGAGEIVRIGFWFALPLAVLFLLVKLILSLR